MLVIVGGVVGVSTAMQKQNVDVPIKPPERLTKKELQIIYKRYNITENDIKFAKGELPYVMARTLTVARRL